ncbi:Rapamycin-insensitive companion of mTOR [Gonioctena quinquepunctata]|nr:Rapamycin-insensitive companion of mTOR [Gonioctena quinquepunctata]
MVIRKAKYSTDEDIIELKASIWSLGNMGSSNRGYDYLTSFGVIDKIVLLATNSPIYSIRATAFYALGLLGTLPSGADDLSRKGWFCTRHDRHDNWPIIKEEIHEGYSGNNPSMSTSEDVISLDNPFLGEFENVDDDEEESGERQDFMRSPCSPEFIRMRQSTLPTNKRPPIVFHVRSMSESKTFDVNHEDHKSSLIPLTFGRQRNSSMTESTTSGVSSCDSLPNKHGTCGNYMKTLSPIPSSSSLSTLQLPPSQFRRGPYRLSSNSTTNSDISTSSLTGSVSNELSIQNLVGYNTLKLLRRMERFNFDRPNFEEYYLLNTTPHLTRMACSLIDDFKIIDSSFTSVFSVPKFEVETTQTHVDKRYMGICLPKVLIDIFPSQEEIQREPFIFHDIASGEEECREEGSEVARNKLLKHSETHCFRCSHSASMGPPGNSVKDETKLEVLQNMERLANPISNKHVRSHLIRFKQREPEAFRDICIYSEVCKMVSENIYRLPTRRVIHELFLEVSFDRLFEPAKAILEKRKEEHGISSKPEDKAGSPPIGMERNSVTSDISSPTESLKTLDSLKLTFYENKFPIRNKNN